MDKVNKQELRRLAEAATPGPWKECGHARGGCSCGMVWSRAADLPVAEAWRGDQEAPEPAEGSKANAAFIAAANPSAILSLLDELEQYRKDAERYRWLREQEAEQGLAVLHVSGWERPATCWATTYPDAELLDAAIDAAMAKEGGANG